GAIRRVSAQRVLPGRVPGGHGARGEYPWRRTARHARSQARETHMSVLDVRNLSIDLPVGADRAQATSSVSFAIERQELLCLVGESGSGKSVIAQAIMGLLPATLKRSSGDIFLEGENLAMAVPHRL